MPVRNWFIRAGNVMMPVASMPGQKNLIHILPHEV